ncbi:acetyl esterase [Actinocorallia herbida]|uniref:Acetyl esterase n=1 Tax=Actinocorallia herbida TaxID=58109 RepID=A0A3N1CX61_9ACTN|nr:alpha/beta hydrolase fold domain-containing protein [Actinocorallia herbida]ROO85883.1 acetyl esterase [Actinocorallia herbida]
MTASSLVSVPGPAGGPAVPVLAHVPADPRGWIVWAHGGSWRFGSAVEWRRATTRLAAASGWAVLSADYRLAPRHRHPRALQDVLAVLTWAADRAAGLPVAVGGDSAGGTLAACAALAVRDRGGALAAQFLAYPPVDPECSAPSFQADPRRFPDPAALREAWRAWRGDGAPVHDTDGTRLHSTPLDACSLAGTAPAVLAVGTDDPVRDDVEKYARRLRGDGVPVRLLRVAGAEHGDVLRTGSRVLDTLADALRFPVPTS